MTTSMGPEESSVGVWGDKYKRIPAVHSLIELNRVYVVNTQQSILGLLAQRAV